MSKEINRRSFLKGTAATLGGVALPAATVSAEPADDRYLVDLESAPDGALDGLEVVHDLDQIGVAVVEGDASDVGARHAKDVELEYDFAAVDHYGDGDEPGPRALSQFQWDKQSQDVSDVHGTTRGEGTRVAVIDSGVMRGHPDLEGALDTERSRNFTGDGGDFTPFINDHGTHVAGIVAGDDDREEGVVGTAPGTELVALRVFTGPIAFFGDILAAMTYSVDVEADVANMSLGMYPLPENEANELLRESVERAASYGSDQGTLFVAAAGNDGADLDDDGDVISLPNEAEGVMSVSATGPVGYRWDDKGNGKFVRSHRAAFNKLREPPTDPAPYTNYGSDAVDISAQGGNRDPDADDAENWQYDLVLSTVFEWGDDDAKEPAYGWKGGTSMAAPQVAAAAALVKSANPDATPDEIRAHLESTARDVGDPEYHGEGHLDVAAAVEQSL